MVNKLDFWQGAQHLTSASPFIRCIEYVQNILYTEQLVLHDLGLLENYHFPVKVAPSTARAGSEYPYTPSVWLAEIFVDLTPKQVTGKTTNTIIISREAKTKKEKHEQLAQVYVS